MKKIAGILILTLISGCSTPEQKERWKNAAAVAAVGLVVLAAVKGGGGGGGYAASTDYDWAWDLFYNNGRYQWACRGMQTGQFADQGRCAYKAQIDHWPNN